LKRPVVTLIVAVLIFFGSLALIPTIGFSLFPKSEKPMFMINIETPLGTNLYETNRIADSVELELKKYSIIRSFATNVGRGNPRIYYNVIPKNEADNFARYSSSSNRRRRRWRSRNSLTR
jgi:multidrug efflux pump subunit AcrB